LEELNDDEEEATAKDVWSSLHNNFIGEINKLPPCDARPVRPSSVTVINDSLVVSTDGFVIDPLRI
jgi:hypothetical protein